MAETGTEGDENMDPPGEGTGEGAEKRSRGSPELVIVLFDCDANEEEPAAALSDGSDNPPSPDNGFSSSANASNEIRSAAFLFGLCLSGRQNGLGRNSRRRDIRFHQGLGLAPVSCPTGLVPLQRGVDEIIAQQ